MQLDRFAGDDARAEAVIFLILVHDPGHDLGVRSHVGRRNVDVGADHVVDAVDELRVMRSSSRSVSLLGSTAMPPLAPP